MAQQGNGAQNGASNGASESWDEPRLLEGMQQLNILHAKVHTFQRSSLILTDHVLIRLGTRYERDNSEDARAIDASILDT